MTPTEAHITRIDDFIRYVKMIEPATYYGWQGAEMPAWLTLKRVSQCDQLDIIGESSYRHNGWIIEVYDNELCVGASNGPQKNFSDVMVQACITLQQKVCAMKVRADAAAPVAKSKPVPTTSGADLFASLFGGPNG